jgi:hypothetical protein
MVNDLCPDRECLRLPLCSGTWVARAPVPRTVARGLHVPRSVWFALDIDGQVGSGGGFAPSLCSKGGYQVAHPNEDLVREGFAAFGRGDMDALRKQFFADDVRWHNPGRSPISGICDTVAPLEA